MSKYRYDELVVVLALLETWQSWRPGARRRGGRLGGGGGRQRRHPEPRAVASVA